MVEQKVLEDFVQGLKPEQKDTNTVHTAIVSNIDDEGVVWVNINGSDKETPTELVATEVKRGDAVTVQWRNNKLYVASNYTNPSAGVVRVSAVEAAAQTAQSAANNAVDDAGRAKEAAELNISVSNLQWKLLHLCQELPALALKKDNATARAILRTIDEACQQCRML